MSKAIAVPTAFKKIGEYLSDDLSPFLDARVVQILLVRQTHDYTVLRTEESRELNTVIIPEDINSTKPTVKVAFLASKQKAAENRMFSRLLRTVSDNECFLKDYLCMKCPRCALFGAVAVKNKRIDYNIRHRIEYSTAFSVEKYDDLLETLTFNAVGEADTMTGQALNLTHNVRPLANFPSVVTLSSPTWQEVALYLKTLLATKSYGAETRVKGDVRNVVLGISAGYEEMITSLEYSLELAALWDKDLGEATQEILEKYAQMCASKSNVVVLTADEVQALLNDVQNLPLDKALVDSMQAQVDAFVKTVKAKKS
jgi:CRISPR type I-D-associated protein Csc2